MTIVTATVTIDRDQRPSLPWYTPQGISLELLP